MNFTHRKLRFTAVLATLFMGVVIPVSGDTHGIQAPASHQFHCYCQCDKHGAHAMCPMKMCELPKYEKRWWATSCHKRPADTSSSKSPAPQPTGRHTRNVLSAKR